MKKTLIGIVVLVVLNIVMATFIFAKECDIAENNPCTYDYEDYLTDSYNGKLEEPVVLK